MEFRAPDGRRIRYDTIGKFIGFLEPLVMKIQIVIASVSDRDHLVAEIWVGDEM